MLSVLEHFAPVVLVNGWILALALVIEHAALHLGWEQAVRESDAYLEALLDEITELAGDVPLRDIRSALYQFDEREAMVNRPEQSYALIPYAVQLREMLTDE